MTAPTPDLGDAIATALDEPGAVVVGWVVVAAFRTPEQNDETGYFYGYEDRQPYHSSLGLLHAGIERLQEQGREP
jgi:hypothetical protein